MLRISSAHLYVACRTPLIIPKISLSISRVFSTSVNRTKGSTTKNEKHFEIVKTEAFPAVDHIDLKKVSVSVRRTFERAREIANKNEIAIEGPPSDSLEALLAMRMRHKK